MGQEDALFNYVRLYRHDVMNNLQLIHGYLQLGDEERVRLKMADVMQMYQGEQKLFKLNMSRFSLFVLFFNHHYPNQQLSYEVNIENEDLATLDEQITEQCKRIIGLYLDDSNHFMYNWFLEVKSNALKNEIVFSFCVKKENCAEKDWKREIIAEQFSFPLSIDERNMEVEYSFTVHDR